VHDRGALAHAADDTFSIDPAQELIQIVVLMRIVPHDGVFDRGADAVIDQSGDGIESARLVGAERILGFEIDDERYTRRVGDLAKPGFETERIARVAAR
jgi:hypothetical protein